MNHQTKNSKILATLILATMAILGSWGNAAASSCDADIEAEFRDENEGSEHKIYIWKVDVTTEEVCADVQFTLWVREVDSSGETTEKNEAFEIKASSREVKSRKVNHVVALGTKVTDWKFKIEDCKPCS